jgi:hypothetical protein
MNACAAADPASVVGGADCGKPICLPRLQLTDEMDMLFICNSKLPAWCHIFCRFISNQPSVAEGAAVLLAEACLPGTIKPIMT